MQGFPHFGQQKWLSFPVPLEELPVLPLVVAGGSVGGLDPVLHNQKLVVIDLFCAVLIVDTIPLLLRPVQMLHGYKHKQIHEDNQ